GPRGSPPGGRPTRASRARPGARARTAPGGRPPLRPRPPETVRPCPAGAAGRGWRGSAAAGSSAVRGDASGGGRGDRGEPLVGGYPPAVGAELEAAAEQARGLRGLRRPGAADRLLGLDDSNSPLAVEALQV